MKKSPLEPRLRQACRTMIQVRAKLSALGVLAAALVAAGSTYAAKEFDCPPAPEAQRSDAGISESEDLVAKRKRAREADLARMRERLTRSAGAGTQPVAPAGQTAGR